MADHKKSDTKNSTPPDDGGLSKDDAVTYEEADKIESNRPEHHDEYQTARITDHRAERKLCFKFDIRLLPVIAIMCPYASI